MLNRNPVMVPVKPWVDRLIAQVEAVGTFFLTPVARIANPIFEKLSAAMIQPTSEFDVNHTPADDWVVRDPWTGRSTWFDSEEEVRVWLEKHRA